MSDEQRWRDSPYRLGRPRSITLFVSGDRRWCFGIRTERGFTDGKLPDSDLSPDQAQAEILSTLATWELVELDGDWRQDGPRSWTAKLRPIP